LKAISFESTEWNFPSMQRTRTSTTGKPASGPAVAASTTPFSTAGIRLGGIAPPHDLVHELDPGPAGQGLDAQEADPEHPLSSRLLLELPLVVLGLAGDRLAIGDLGGLEVDVVLVEPPQALHGDPDVKLAHAGEQELPGARIP
jgi:hypothetical protein